MLCQPAARGPPFSHRGVLGVELGETAGRAASEKQLVETAVRGRNGGLSACLLCRELGFVAQRAGWDRLGLEAQLHGRLSHCDCQNLSKGSAVLQAKSLDSFYGFLGDLDILAMVHKRAQYQNYI